MMKSPLQYLISFSIDIKKQNNFKSQVTKKYIRKNVFDILKRKTDVIMKSLKSHISHLFCHANTFTEFVEETIKYTSRTNPLGDTGSTS